MTRRRSSFLLPNVHVPTNQESADLSSIGKQALHVLCCCALVYIFADRFVVIGDEYPDPVEGEQENEGGHGGLFIAVLFLSRVATLLWFPQYLFNFCGMVFFNSFKHVVTLRYNYTDAPVISFRTVTRGTYPALVAETVRKNMEVLRDSGIQNYVLEVITEVPLGLEKQSNFLERVIPQDYQTKSGSKFKARALQYCLDEPNEAITLHSWFVHLDEETVLTEEAVKGIVNFCFSGKHPLGNGLITYAHDDVGNWVTTVIDAYRIADDLGQFRFQFKVLHQPLFAWKGSFMVANAAVEKKIGFENGMAGSITEDQFFAMVAARNGYSFDFVEGEMHEKSPFTIMDQVLQRKRWLQGGMFISQAPTIPLKVKGLLLMKHWASRLVPLMLPSLIFGLFWPVPTIAIIDILAAFTFAVRCYGFTFGILRTFPNEEPFKALCVLASPLAFLFDLGIDCVAAVWGGLTVQDNFYVVQKDVHGFKSS